MGSLIDFWIMFRPWKIFGLLVILSLSTEAAVLWHDQFSNEPILNSIFGDSPAIFYEPTFSMKSNPIKPDFNNGYQIPEVAALRIPKYEEEDINEQKVIPAIPRKIGPIRPIGMMSKIMQWGSSNNMEKKYWNWNIPKIHITR